MAAHAVVSIGRLYQIMVESEFQFPFGSVVAFSAGIGQLPVQFIRRFLMAIDAIIYDCIGEHIMLNTFHG